jgi:DinB superfamily
MMHPLVQQLRFTRHEFLRGIEGLTEEEAQKRFLPMNCISWNVGHLTWQEQRYFLYYAQGQMPLPEIDRLFRYGGPASTPPLAEMLSAWKNITRLADPWLEALTVEKLEDIVIRDGKPGKYIFGSLLQRTIYHYWYHNGENQAIRQMLGHRDLPEFVGDLDDLAPYRREHDSK